jgi:hypothetical protein
MDDGRLKGNAPPLGFIVFADANGFPLSRE